MNVGTFQSDLVSPQLSALQQQLVSGRSEVWVRTRCSASYEGSWTSERPACSARIRSVLNSALNPSLCLCSDCITAVWKTSYFSGNPMKRLERFSPAVRDAEQCPHCAESTLCAVCSTLWKLCRRESFSVRGNWVQMTSWTHTNSQIHVDICVCTSTDSLKEGRTAAVAFLGNVVFTCLSHSVKTQPAFGDNSKSPWCKSLNFSSRSRWV